MPQGSIFDPPPSTKAKARRTDPRTSKAAAESLPPEAVARQIDRVLWALIDCEDHSSNVGATAVEIVMRLAYTGYAPQQSVVASRLSQLHARGLIVDTGDTRPGASTRELIVWSATPEGRAHIAERKEAA